MIEDEVTQIGRRTVLTMEYDSLDQFVERCKVRDPHFATRWTANEWRERADGPKSADLALNGWPEQLQRAIDVAEHAVTKVEKEHDIETFVPTWDVFGSDVDMGRFVVGEPECMIDYPLKPVVKAGKVITLCANMALSASIKPETIIRRGHAVTALAMALAKLGYSFELWVDQTIEGWGTSDTARVRVKVKDANDVLDPERIMYAVGHPSMLRTLVFAAEIGMPSKWRDTMGVPAPSSTSESGMFGKPVAAIQDMPEGTIYLPHIQSGIDVPSADEALVDYLRQLDIITD